MMQGRGLLRHGPLRKNSAPFWHIAGSCEGSCSRGKARAGIGPTSMYVIETNALTGAGAGAGARAGGESVAETTIARTRRLSVSGEGQPHHGGRSKRLPERVVFATRGMGGYGVVRYALKTFCSINSGLREGEGGRFGSIARRVTFERVGHIS